jgi:gluconolactonase
MSLLSSVEPVRAVLERPHGLLEGPRLAAGGEMVYSDVIAGGVWACAADGSVRELLPKRRGIGGIVPHEDGGWVLSGSTVLHLRPDGGQRTLLDEESACGFNDLGSTAAGELLAGMLRYRPLAGEEPRNGALVRLGLEGAVTTLTEEVVWPNGIGVSPDGATIYLSDYARRLVLTVPAAGGETAVLCHSPAGSVDGLAVDREGGVWVALGESGAVARFSPDGELDELIPLPARFISSLSFGGEDMRDVLITTADNEVDPGLGGTLLRARSAVAGLTVEPLRV